MELKDQFEQAVANSKLLSKNPDNETLLKLYSLFKQSTEGDNNKDESISPFDFVAKAKNNAWSELRGLSRDEAMQRYIDLIKKLQS